MPSRSLGDMVVRIVGDNKEFDAGIDKSEKKFNNFAKNAARIGKNLTKFVTLPLVGMAAAAVKFAVDAEETRAKFGTAFRGIRETADATAKNLAKNFGLSTTQAERLLSGTGDLLKGFGATEAQALDLSSQVQELAVDLASYNNVVGGANRASGALTSALLGEREALKSLGIVVNAEVIQAILLKNGQENLEGQALLLAKAQATLQAAMEQSQDAIGDFKRTSGSTANQMRILRATAQDVAVEFGQVMLPAVNKLLGRVSDFSGFISDLDANQKRLIITILALTAAAGPALIAIKAITAATIGLNTAMAFLAANPITLVVAGIFALIAGGVLLVKKYKDMKDANVQFSDSLDTTNQKLKDQVSAIDELNELYRTSHVFSKQRQIDVDAQIANLETWLKQFDRQLVIVESVQKKIDAEILRLAQLKKDRDAFISGTLEGTLPDAPGTGTAFTRAQKAIEHEIALIKERAALAIKTGEEFNEVEETRAAILEEINDLIDEGNKVHYPGTVTWVEQLLELYEDQLLAEEELDDSAESAAGRRLEFLRLRAEAERKLAEGIAAAAAAGEEAAAAALKKELADIERRKEAWRSLGVQMTSVIRDIANIQFILGQRNLKILDREHRKALDLMDERQQKALADAGFAEKTTVENLQAQLAAAIEAGETETAAELTQSIARAEILATQAETRKKLIADFEKTRAELEYQGALKSWKLNLVGAIANGALAIINALRSVPFPLNLVVGATVAALVAPQIALVAASKPVPLAAGGIVTPKPGGTIARVAEAGQPEVIFPLDQLESFLSQRPDLEGAGGGDIRLVVNMDSKPILEKIFPATRNRTVLIDARAVT